MSGNSSKMDAVSIRVPYRSLKQEVELVGVDQAQLRRLQIATQNRHNRIVSSLLNNSEMNSSSNSPSPPPLPPTANGDAENQQEKRSSLLALILSCTVAAGVQFGWALQLSLLTPYIQTLGIQHAFSSFIWLCGPITGLVVIIIGFSADIGYFLGDTKEHCSTFKGTRTRAAIVFIIGFWMLDLANNTVQGPARALLADLAGPDQLNSANAVYCSWMAVGNILGFSSGASGNWHRWFPFLLSRACCEACGNLKAAFLVAVVFLTLCMLVTLHFAKEVPLAPKQPPRLSDAAPLLDNPEQIGFDLSKSEVQNGNAMEIKSKDDTLMGDGNVRSENQEVVEDAVESFSDSPGAVLVNLLTSLRKLPPAMHSVLLVMALTWLSWFPFFLFDTDWMGREVYHGDPKGDVSEVKAYGQGVREGAFGLLLNSVVLGISSFFIEPMCQWMGAGIVWAMSNFMVFVCMAGTAIISLVSVRGYSEGVQHVVGANGATKVASLVVFGLLGLPLAITYSVPFSVTAELTADSGGGQGLAIGVLNLAIVLPQMVVSLGAGPWDALFGGGNIPAFVLASLCALAAGILATRKLPNIASSSYRSTGLHFG
ncbi:sucrose transport protein SUC3 isoform X2 [Coffea arabica]|uniref:Sucrose transport protein SUC3 isoform X2 n=1 Tax=Coffea arabica TaxID=13443 RepID=A0ABM4WAB3_COFAR